MLNKVTLIGRLGADPEARFTQDGTCVCNLRIATTEQWKDKQGQKQEKTEWHKIVMWGRLGEIANQYLTKGSLVYIDGKIETRKWQNKDGQDQYTTEIRATEMKMLGGNDRSGSQDGRQQAGGGSGDAFPSRGGSMRQSDPFADDGAAGGALDGDIPF